MSSMADIDCHLDNLADRAQMMPRTFGFGRPRQSSDIQQDSNPYTDSHSPMFTGTITSKADNNPPPSAFARLSRPDPSDSPRTIESGELRIMSSSSRTRAVPQEEVEFARTGVPSQSYNGALKPRAVELPSTLEIGGFLYQRVDMNLSGDVTMTSNGHRSSPVSAGLPLIHPYQDRRISRTCESLSQASTSTSLQLSNAHIVQPTPRRSKRRVNLLRELQSNNDSSESEWEPEAEKLRPTTASSSQQALRKSKHKSRMLRELEGFNKSPEPSSDCEQDNLRVNNRRSSKPVPPKIRRRSVMLRELEAHNQSPELDSEPEMETLRDLKDDWSDAPLTRSVRKELVSKVKGRPVTPRKDLNVGKLMLTEFSGMKKGTKTFYAEDSNLGASYRVQRKSRKERDFWGEEDDEEEDLKDEEEDLQDEEENLPKTLETNARNHRQPMATRQKALRQVETSLEKSQRNKEFAADMAWRTWDNQKEKPRQSRGASNDQERDFDSRPPKRIAGFRNTDRVSDDGDRIGPSTQASTSQPSANKKTTRMTFNPHKSDMGDPEDAFGSFHGSDEGSPIGGARPRDLITGRLLMPHEWQTSRRKRSDGSEDAPRKHSRHH